MVAMGEHYRPTGDVVPDGIYRVVGIPEDVTLLRVGDSRSRRRYTGELYSVSLEAVETAFERAADPASGLVVVPRVRNALQGLYWSVRRFF